MLSNNPGQCGQGHRAESAAIIFTSPAPKALTAYNGNRDTSTAVTAAMAPMAPGQPAALTARSTAAKSSEPVSQFGKRRLLMSLTAPSKEDATTIKINLVTFLCLGRCLVKTTAYCLEEIADLVTKRDHDGNSGNGNDAHDNGILTHALTAVRP